MLALFYILPVVISDFFVAAATVFIEAFTVNHGSGFSFLNLKTSSE
jgi:hypothetical protein